MGLIERVILIVLDSVGVGKAPDASDYGDQGSDTLGNISRVMGGLKLPNLGNMGLGRLHKIEGVAPALRPMACYGRMRERSKGKDTTTGHWEIAGLYLDKPFPTFPNGFPPGIIEPFKQQTGRGVLGNKAASGTEIIEELGPEHQRTGDLIVYTSADSVFQVAAHEDTVPLAELYRYCEIARKMLDPLNVGRVIARPFIGEPGSYRRTYNRKDFSLPPTGPTLLDHVKEAGLDCIAVGKISSVFSGSGVTESIHTDGNADGMQKTEELMKRDFNGLAFINLVDFDMLWGHRNNPEGYAKGLEEFDAWLPRLLARMTTTDMLAITADHGCDPTTESTDHSREEVPLLVAGPSLRKGVDLGTRQTFADLGQTIADVLGAGILENGDSFYSMLLE
ncbi:MAG: phosphopentomutase [Deltaproteobacteria bacterium]|nr:phosphopentomutase [Deltaproteobacteria bacterium]